MRLGTLLFHACDEAIEGVVLAVCHHPCVLIKTVWALLVGSVTTLDLGGGQGSCLTDAVGALRRGGMVASATSLLLLIFTLSTVLSFFFV